jgi:pimeloyl-ACP methyl ester carboxylesterase
MFRALSFAAALFAATTVQAQAEAQNRHGTHSEHGSAHGHHHADFASDRIHVRIDGDMDGRDIILIPGLSSSPEIWQGTVDHLTAQDGVGWRVHRIHVQGFAGAPAEGNAQTGDAPTPVAAPVADEIARYIRENNLPKPAVVGHSMGGTIGLMLAARHPDSVGRLMVVDMIPFMGAMFGPPGPTAAKWTRPTGLSGPPPPGPAIPVTETLTLAFDWAAAPSAMARAVGSETAPWAIRVASGTPNICCLAALL